MLTLFYKVIIQAPFFLSATANKSPPGLKAKLSTCDCVLVLLVSVTSSPLELTSQVFTVP